MRFSTPGISLFLCIALCTAPAARAADPQTYRVDIASTGDGAMDDTLSATSELVALRGTAPVSPFGLIARARGEVDRLKTVLESYGYYQSAVSIKIEGMALNSGGLAEALTALPKGREARVEAAFQLGPLYHLRDVKLEGSLPQSAESTFSLKPGAPAVASDVLAAGSRLLTTLREQGYAFAKVDAPIAYEDQTAPLLDVNFHVDAGPKLNIGEIHIDGLKRLHEKLMRRRLTLHTGQLYSSSAIEAARRDLLTLAPIAAINVQLGTSVDATGGVPVTFVIRERLRHAVAVNSAYSTDLGGSAGITWSDRNVFGNAEQLNIAASVINLGGSATTGLGYDTSAKFTIPDFHHRDQSLQITVGSIKQSLEAYDQKAITSGATLTRKLSSVWSASVGIATANEQIMQEDGKFLELNEKSVAEIKRYNYTLIAVPLGLNYDSTHLASPLDDPTHGMRDSLSVTPTRSLGDPSVSFVISQIKLAGYFDLHEFGIADAGRTVIAARALAGVAEGAGEFSLPPDQRFYGGGSGTIRGFRYQSVGPLFADGNPVGGTAIVAGTLELRQRFGRNFGGALFVDGGQVSASLKPLPSEVRVGAGVGVRYYTPIGPVRFDVAVPTRHYKPALGTVEDDDAFEIYIGLGQAF